MTHGQVGDKIKIIKMDGEPEYQGKTGEILLIDAMGQLHGTWVQAYPSLPPRSPRCTRR